MQQNKLSHSVLKILLSLVFPLFYLYFCYFARPADDEFGYLDLAINKGIIKGGLINYTGIEGEILLTFLQIAALKIPIYLFFILNLCVLYFAMIFFLKSVFIKLKYVSEFPDLFLMSSTILSASYYMSPDIQDLWYWRLIVVGYSSVFIFLLFSIGFILRGKIYTAIPFLIMLMHSRFTWALLFFALFSIYTLYEFHKGNKQNKFYLAIILMIIALVIYLIAPGNWIHRISYFNKNETIMWTWNKLFYTEFIFRIPHLIIFTLPVIFIVPTALIEKIKLKKAKILIPLAVFSLLVLSHSMLLFIAIKRFYHQPRLWCVMSYMLIFLVIYYGLLIKSYLLNNIDKLRGTRIFKNDIVCILFLLLPAFFYYKSYILNKEKASNYAKEFDAMNSLTTNFDQNKNKTLTLSPLPDAGILKPSGLQQIYFLRAYKLLHNIKTPIQYGNLKIEN